MRHCNTCECPENPRHSLTVQKATVTKVGSCNFCDRNIGPTGMTGLNDPVYELGGCGLRARLCVPCLRSLVGVVRMAGDLK
jgi:hypothetical protein